MAILGIESTAHTASIGIADERAGIIAIASDVYKPEKGGIHPREAANHHAEAFPRLLEKLQSEGKLDPDEIKAIGFSQGPGLGPCLRTGATVARVLAMAWDKPLVPVNHCIAHIEIARVLSRMEDPILLYVSGRLALDAPTPFPTPPPNGEKGGLLTGQFGWLSREGG